MESTVVAAMSSMSVKADCSRQVRKVRKGRLVIGRLGTDCSRPAFPGRAFARKGRKGGFYLEMRNAPRGSRDESPRLRDTGRAYARNAEFEKRGG